MRCHLVTDRMILGVDNIGPILCTTTAMRSRIREFFVILSSLVCKADWQAAMLRH